MSAPVPQAAPDPIEILVAKLRLSSREDLLAMPEALLTEAVQGESIEARAATFAALGRLRAEKARVRDPATALVEQFERQDRRNRDAWRSVAEAAEAERGRVTSAVWEEVGTSIPCTGSKPTEWWTISMSMGTETLSTGPHAQS